MVEEQQNRGAMIVRHLARKIELIWYRSIRGGARLHMHNGT
jgi:hypothetical protein